MVILEVAPLKIRCREIKMPLCRKIAREKQYKDGVDISSFKDVGNKMGVGGI